MQAMRSEGGRRPWDQKKNQSSHLPSADGSDTLHLLPRLQLEHPATFHLLIPELHSPALLSAETHTHTHTHTDSYSTLSQYR